MIAGLFFFLSSDPKVNRYILGECVVKCCKVDSLCMKSVAWNPLVWQLPKGLRGAAEDLTRLKKKDPGEAHRSPLHLFFQLCVCLSQPPGIPAWGRGLAVK